MIHYIINLERSQERRSDIAKRFVQQGIVLPPHFWPAVDGSQLSSQEKELLCSNPCLNNAEIGCAASHLEIYRHMLTNGYHSAFIFEDDIDIASEVTQNLLLQIQAYFDTISHPAILQLRKVRNIGKQVATIANIPIYEVFRTGGAFAYLINQQAAQIVLQENSPIRFESDMWKMYKQAGLIEIYALGKNLFWPNQLAKQSTIDRIDQRANSLYEHQKRKEQFKRAHGFNLWRSALYRLRTYYYRYIVHGKWK